MRITHFFCGQNTMSPHVFDSISTLYLRKRANYSTIKQICQREHTNHTRDTVRVPMAFVPVFRQRQADQSWSDDASKDERDLLSKINTTEYRWCFYRRLFHVLSSGMIVIHYASISISIPWPWQPAICIQKGRSPAIAFNDRKNNSQQTPRYVSFCCSCE